MTYAQDLQRQAVWLAMMARKRGETLDDLADRHPRMFQRLAAKWRARQPLAGVTA